MTGSEPDNWIAPDYRPGLVSVIIPTYNRADLISETLDRVGRQTYRPIEMIVIDDGSEDGTVEIIKEWKRRFCNGALSLVYVRQNNLGAGAARNRGLKLSKGEYIQFLDSDDLLHAEKIERSVNLARAQGASVAVAHVARFSSASQNPPNLVASPAYRPNRSDPTRSPYYSVLRWDGPIPLYLRAILNKVGPFREDIRFGEGAEFVVRVKLSGAQIVYIPHVLYFYRIGSSNALTRSGPGQWVVNQLRLLEASASLLRKAGITDRHEWRKLTRDAVKTAYRAYIYTERGDETREALILAKNFATAWSRSASTILRLPTAFLLSVMTTRHLLRRISGRLPGATER